MHSIPLIAIEGIVLLGLSVVGLIEGIYIVSRPDPFAMYDRIGPGRSLIFLSLILMGAVIAYLILYRHTFGESAHRLSWQGIKGNLGQVMGLIAGYVFLTDVIGFVYATPLFLCFIFRLLGVESWLKSATLSILFALSMYLVFVQGFHMDLPDGWLLNL